MYKKSCVAVTNHCFTSGSSLDKTFVATQIFIGKSSHQIVAVSEEFLYLFLMFVTPLGSYLFVFFKEKT